MKICASKTSDIELIAQLFTATFSDSEGKDEGLLIGNLAHELLTTTHPKDLYSFIATEQNEIIACIIFSKLTLESNISAFLLSPVAVRTNEQKKGIAQKLINHAIENLKDEGVQLLFTYGDPNFYNKVGFSPVNEQTIRPPYPLTYPEGWLGQSLIAAEVPTISGQSFCADALSNADYW